MSAPVITFSCNTFTRGHIIHTIQIILVEADSPEDAFREVEMLLENSNNPSWSDWHNASGWEEKNFAGRWSNAIFLTPEQEKMLEDDTLDKSTIPNFLCYSDNPELADYIVDKFAGYRKQAMRENVPSTGDEIDLGKLIDNYDPSASFSVGSSMELWRVSKLFQLLNDDWTSETAIYDLSSDTGNLDYYHTRCKSQPQKQYLIPVDFHH
jgi:hypothetical protein